MHSYGGQVGTNALYGLSKKARGINGQPGGIYHLIYMAAFALPEGKSIIDKVAEFNDMDRIPVAFGIDEDQTCVSNYPREGLIGEPYADQVDPQEVEAYIQTIGRWNGNCMFLPIQNTSAWREEAKVLCIRTSGDLIIPVEYQRNMVEVMEKEGKTIETIGLETGHSPHLTATEAVVKAVLRFTGSER